MGSWNYQGQWMSDPNNSFDPPPLPRTQQGFFDDFWQTYSGRNDYRAPDITYDPAQANQARDAQGQAIDQAQASNAYYRGLMNGTQPSLAQRQMRQGINQAGVQAWQGASAARGVDRSAAYRQAAQNAANARAQGAVAGGNLRLAEQQVGAQGNLQGSLGQASGYGAIRGGDINEQQGAIALKNQQAGINAGVTNANAANQSKAAGGLMQMGGAALAAMFGSDEELKTEAKVQDAVSKYPTPKQDAPASSGGDDSGMAAMGMSLGSMFSDLRAKEDVSPWSSGVEPYKFRYNDDFAQQKAQAVGQQAYLRALEDAKRPRAGIMAQDLAASPNTRDMVIQTPAGLAIDRDRALGHLMAAQSDVTQRLDELEGKGRR